MTLARVKKIMQKVTTELDKPLNLSHTPRIANQSYHDMLTEEIWGIQKKAVDIDFRKLKGICTKKAVLIYKDLLQGVEERGINNE